MRDCITVPPAGAPERPHGFQEDAPPHRQPGTMKSSTLYILD
jgi:hypothetical protein